MPNFSISSFLLRDLSNSIAILVTFMSRVCQFNCRFVNFKGSFVFNPLPRRQFSRNFFEIVTPQGLIERLTNFNANKILSWFCLYNSIRQKLVNFSMENTYSSVISGIIYSTIAYSSVVEFDYIFNSNKQ